MTSTADLGKIIVNASDEISSLKRRLEGFATTNSVSAVPTVASAFAGINLLEFEMF